jgi:alkylation response protein AidB-like acyl-CoA dehydrogenase
VDFALTEEQRLLRDEIIRFARQELNDGAAERDRTQTFPRELWRRCGEMGLPGLPVPESLGGAGLDPLSCAIALEALGYGCTDGGLVFTICAHVLSCVVPIWTHGTDDQKRRYLPALCSGEHIGVHAMTEPGSGSDAFALRTVATAEDGGYRLDGTKMFISNGPVADIVVVFAMTDAAKGYHGGVTAFIVERGTSGFSASTKIDKMGLRTSHLGELVFDGVFVPADAILGGVGGGSTVFTKSMDWERTCLFASQVGTMERLLETSIEYARTRRQFGQPIGKFQAVSHRIVDMKLRLEAARSFLYQVGWAKLQNGGANTPTESAMAKLYISEAWVQSGLDTLQILAGYGYMTETELEREIRDSLASRIYSGTSDIQRNIIAGRLGL